jgi:hypothetical protein
MTRAWRYIVALTGGVAIAVPVQLHFDLGSYPDLQLTSSTAFAKPGEGGNGNAGGNGNSGNGGGKGSDSEGGRGNAGGGNGNSGNGNAGNGGGNPGNGGGKGSDGGKGNAGAGKGGDAVGNGSSGKGGGSVGGNTAGGEGKNGGETGGRNSNQGSGSKAAGEASGSKSNAASGRSSEGSGQSRQSNKSAQTGQASKAERTEKAKPARVDAVKSTKSVKQGQSIAANGKTKASSMARSGSTAKSSAARSAGKATSGTQAQGAPRQGNVTRAASTIDDWFEPLGSPSKPRQARDSIVVSGLSEQDLANLAASGLLATSQTRGSIVPRIVRLNLPRGMSLAEARRMVERVNLQASADFDSYYYADGGAPACSDPGCGASTLVGWTPPGLDQCVAQARVGLIDTGIDLEHEALKGQAIEVITISDAPAGASSKDHGTAIAALLVGRSGSAAPGLIPQAELIAVDAFSKGNGTADRADVLSLVKALEALADRGVKVVNLSLSGPPNDVLKKAIEAAQAQGIVLVAAAGNNGAGAEPSYPAAYPGVIAVTAVDRQLKVYRRATHGQYVTFAAPGVEIQTAHSKSGRATKSGTSYAVPFVAAAMTMVGSAHPETDIGELRKRLQDSTRDLGAPGRDDTFGYGLVQMANLCTAPKETPIPVASGLSVAQEGAELP